MMAGVVPKRSASGRKQWTLHDGPRSSLKRLRSQLASDGCPESQVVLAKQLLDERCEIEADAKENARLGVYWLIKASEQGNVEATNLLKSCLQSGKGISELNYLDVKSCITMTQDEKLARKAAREIFASLSNGGEYITSDQLQKKILAIDRDQSAFKTIENSDINEQFSNGELVYDECTDSDSSETDWSQKSENGSNEKLTEDHLISAATDYSQGHLPLVNQILCLTKPDLRALDCIPHIQRSILHPWLAIKILYYKILRFLGKQIIFSFLSSEFHFLLLLFIYLLVSSDNILFFIPMVLYYVSFIIMIVVTFQMLQNKHELADFRLWSGLFICYSGGNLNAEQSENQYIRNNLRPYGNFFLAFLTNLAIYPVIADQWIPQSELMIISFCLTFATLIGFMRKRRSKIIFDYMVLFSFGVNVLAKYPYDTDPVVAQSWRFLDLKVPTFASYVIGNGIEFCINFRLVLYLCIPLIFVKIAQRRNWKSTYETLIPHCVTLSWLQVCIISSQGATVFGLLRGTLALVGVVLFLPLFGLTSIFLPAAALTKWIITSSTAYGVCLFIILSLIILVLCWISAKSRYKKITASIQVFSMITSLIILLNSLPFLNNNNNNNNSDFYEDISQNDLSWEVFQRFCHQPVWQEENIAIAQLKCAMLQESSIHWDGYINDIKIKSISNIWLNVFNKFPKNLRDYLICFYGDETGNDCTNLPELAKNDCALFYNAIKSKSLCNLNKYNVYIFEITIRMGSGIWGKKSEVHLIVDHFFKNFTLNLKPNDHIWFKGALFNNEIIGSNGILGGFKPHVILEEMGCLSCDNNLSEIKISKCSSYNIRSIVDSLYLSIKFILNVLFNPIVIFK